MKFSESWVREWVNPSIDSAQLCDQITMLGLEVDGVEGVAEDFTGVVVGEVVECGQHPNADKLRVTKVNVGGDRLLDIVCGAPNCRQGLKVACATVGAVLPGNFKIKAAKLRGEPSEGMLCSFTELGIDVETDGIIELPADAPVGQNIREYLGLEDKIVEISLTPNRADCLSILGIAREVAVVNDLPLVNTKIEAVEPSHEEAAEINLTASEACPRYISRIIKNVNLDASSPLWMQEKLRRCGIRSIDPIVDVTNYILLELGQPMHAFDLDKIAQPIDVRMANEGEPLTLLDGNEVKLGSNTLIIADQKGPLAMAGIFGGQDSGVQDGTTNILLESAFFAPLAITGRARQYGLHTDSSHRFERGVDYQEQRRAIERATALIVEICGGEVGPVSEVSAEEKLPKQSSVVLTRKKIDSLLGHHIETAKITQILEQLGFAVTYQQDTWTVVPTSWRFDIEIEEDLIEEVARIYGYNSIPNNAPLANLLMREHKESDVDLALVKHAFVNKDYQEAITYSFVDPKTQALLHEEEALSLPNPISEDMSAMRLSLMTGLLGAVKYNQNRQQSRVRLFETGLRFIPSKGAELDINQEFVLAAVISGASKSDNWHDKSTAIDFFDLKGDLEDVLELIGASNSVKFVAKSYKALHPGQSAAIVIDGNEVGFIGKLHPAVAQKLDISKDTVVLEISWDAISSKEIMQAKEISRFPANKRDIAVVVTEDTPSQDVLDYCKEVAGELLIQTTLFDVYQGQGIDEGYKSLAISFILQDQNKTLTENEITDVIERVVSELKTRFNAYLRE